jgi:hypothetical protein
MVTTLRRFSDWYRSQCNDTWEHQYGIRIDSLDNPGWSVTISLTGTPLESRVFTAREDRYEDELVS